MSIYYISKMKYAFLTLLFVILLFKINAQKLSFEKIGITEGLPHFNSINVFEDSKGFLWIGTIGGIAKYDGNKFKCYTTQDGLNSNIIRSINEDNDNNIWIGTEKGICKLKNDSITAYFLDNIRLENTESIYIDNKNEIYIGNEIGLFVYNTLLDSFVKHPLVETEVINTIIGDDHNNLWYGSRYGLYKILKDTVQRVFIPGESENQNNSVVSSLKDCYGNLWFGTVSGFVKWADDSLYTFHQKPGLENAFPKLNQLADSSFLFGTYGGGIISFTDPNKITRQSVDESNKIGDIVMGISQTRGGSIWLATTTGLLKSKKNVFSEIKEYTDSLKNNIFEIKKDFNNTYWYATDNGVKSYNSLTKKLQHYIVSENPNENFIISLFIDKVDSSIYAGSFSGRCYRFKDNNFIPFMDEEYKKLGSLAAFNIFRDSNKDFWISKSTKVVKGTDLKNEDINVNDFNSVYETLESDDNTIWFASSNAISYLRDDSIYHIKSINNVALEQIKHIELDKNNTLWVGANGSGVFKYKNGVGQQVTIKDGLTSNFIQSLLYVQEYNQLWVGTINGISKISLDDKSNIIDIQNYTNPEILNCNDFALFYDINDGILVGIEDKIYNYNPKNDIPNTNVPIVRLDNIQLFNRDFDFTTYTTEKDSNSLPQNLILPFNQNHLTFNFYGIEFNQPKNVMYSIKLDGFDSDWSAPNKNRSITYNNLPPNTYTFKIKAKNSDGLWSENFEYSFSIDSPFYKKWWFIDGILLLIGLIIFIIISKRIKKIKAIAEIEKNIAQLELKALRAQMNPHFIFNILNNIQNFVVNQKTDKAINLLGEFAVLIRSILDISSDKTIVLSKEVEFLTTYINLDLTQYPDKYNYEFNFSDNIDQDNILIPPMLIQPFVENAILHGLIHKNETGLLKISFTQKENTLICVIEDNGVGRIKSKEMSVDKYSHKSKALNISNDRVNQFNTMEKTNPFKIDIIDLLDENNIGIGTKVIIEMPSILKY